MIRPGRLLEELERFTPADAAERASLERIRALLSTAADPFTRERTDHVTGSAVVSRPSGEAFLLIYHRRLERWLQPGGHVERGDASVFEAARREAVEETGIAELEAPFGPRLIDVDVHPIPAKADTPAHVHFDLRYLLTTRQETWAVAEAEVHRAAWFSLEQAAASGADGSVLRALLKSRSLLGDG